MKRANKLLAAVLALALCLGLTACGDSFERAVARAAGQMAKAESVHADMALNMGVELDILGQQSGMDIGVGMSMDTAGGLTSGEMTFEMLGFSLPMQYIVEKDGESYNAYLSMDGGESWSSELGISAEELSGGDNGIGSLSAADLAVFYLECGTSFGDPVEETIDGAECRRYDGLLPGASLGEAFALAGGSSFAELPDGAEPADSPISIWLEKSSGLPRRISVDMTGAIAEYISASLADSGLAEGAVGVNEVTVTVDLSGWNETVPATPPVE